MLALLRRRTSPFALLERQSGLAVLAADLLHALVHDAQAWARAQAITALAQEGHDLVRDLVRRRRGLWLMPFDREDLYALARGVDAVLDALRVAADAVEPPRAASRPPSVGPWSTSSPRAWPPWIRRFGHCATAMPRSTTMWWRSTAWKILALLRWIEIYERLEAVTNRCEAVAEIVDRIAARQI